MNGSKTLAIVLIIAGALSLAYGSFTYTKKTHDAKIGPMEISIKDKETVNIPAWLGGGVLIAGVVLLIAGSRK